MCWSAWCSRLPHSHCGVMRQSGQTCSVSPQTSLYCIPLMRIFSPCGLPSLHTLFSQGNSICTAVILAFLAPVFVIYTSPLFQLLTAYVRSLTRIVLLQNFQGPVIYEYTASTWLFEAAIIVSHIHWDGHFLINRTYFAPP